MIGDSATRSIRYGICSNIVAMLLHSQDPGTHSITGQVLTGVQELRNHLQSPTTSPCVQIRHGEGQDPLIVHINVL